MASPFYFHWIDIGHSQEEWLYASTWDDSFATVDEQVLTFLVEHQEGQIPSLTIEVKNPHIGLLAPGRKIWAWLAYDDNGTPAPLFFGRLVGIPTDMLGEAVTLHFTARSINYIKNKQLAAEPLKVRPYYDPVFLDLMKRDDPDAILEARAALWHIDRVNIDDIRASDILIGEDGTAAFIESDVPYDSVKVELKQPPLVAISVVGTVNWTQADIGYLNWGTNSFNSYSGDGIIADWPKPLTTLGGGWSVAYSDAVDAYGITWSLTASFSTSWQNTATNHVQGDTMSVELSQSMPVLYNSPHYGSMSSGISSILPLDGWDTGMLGSRSSLSPQLVMSADITKTVVTGWLDPFATDIEGLSTPKNIPASVDISTQYVPLWKVNTSLILRYDAVRQRTESVQFVLSADTQPLITSPLITQDTEQINISGSDVSGLIIDLLNWSSVAGKPVGLAQYVFPDNPTIPGQTSIQVCIVAGVAGLDEPVFSNIAGQTTLDGSVVWSSLGTQQPPAIPADWTRQTVVPVGQLLVPRPPLYQSFAATIQGGLQQIPPVGVPISLYQIVEWADLGGVTHYFQCMTPGATLAFIPSWDTSAYGAETGPPRGAGTVVWVYIGTTLPSGAYLYLSTPGASPSSHTTDWMLPSFPTTIGATVLDGGVEWTCAGPVNLPVGGYPGHTPGRSYFPADRGLWSLEHLLYLARARLLLRARAVEISWDCRMERAAQLSCRMNASIADPRLPGGVAAGKVIAYTMKGDGDRGLIIGNVRIGCAVGLGNVIEPADGTATYVNDGYVYSNYQYNDFAIVVPDPHLSDVGYTPPKAAPDDDGLTFPITDPAQVRISEGFFGSIYDQIKAITTSFDAAIAEAQATALNPSNNGYLNVEAQLAGIARGAFSLQNGLMQNPMWYELQIKPVDTGPFVDAYSITTTTLAIPKTIDLEAASTP